MGNSDNKSADFGWAEILAGALAVSVAAIAAPSPAASAELVKRPAQVESDDWNFLWLPPTPSSSRAAIEILETPSSPLVPLSASFAERQTEVASTEYDPKKVPSQTLSRRIEHMPVGIRFTPPVNGSETVIPSIMMREDNWTMVDIDRVMRVSAYARGPLDVEDTAQAQTPSTFPRGLGTGLSVVTSTPIYVGATVKTDRSIYDIDADRFRGARWSTSVFIGTDTAFGPVSLGASQDPTGARATYLYLGRWF
jgi:hypothetical protein